MTVVYNTPGVERRSSKSNHCCLCCCSCCCLVSVLFCLVFVFLKAPIHEMLYDDLPRPECATTDCSSAALIPGPKLFSTRGQLDEVFEVKKDYEMDLVMKIAELANFSYEMDPEKSGVWNLHRYNSEFAVQSKHLIVHEMRVFDESDPDFESYRSVGIIAKMNTGIGEVCIISIRGTETMDDWVVNFNAAELSDGFKALHGGSAKISKIAFLFQNDLKQPFMT